MKSIKLILLFTIFSSIFCFGQKVDYENLKKRFPKSQMIFLEYNIELEITLKDDKIRIYKTTETSKILLDENAKKYEDEQIYFSNVNKINHVEASCQALVGKKYKKHKVKDFETINTISDRYFYDDSKIIKFTYPSINQGSICKLKYSQEIFDPLFVPNIFLSNPYPISELNIKISVHEDIDLQLKEFNIDEDLPIEESKKGKNNIYKLTLEDVDRISLDGGSSTYLYNVPHLILAIKSYKLKDKMVNVMSTRDDLFKKYSEYISKVDTSSNQLFRSTVDSLVSDINTDKEKVKVIFDWVKSNIKYIAFEDNMGGFIPRDPQLVFDRKFGDCKDMSSIIIKMLNLCGIKGHFAWVGTRDLPYKYEDIYGFFIDNHMIAVYYSEEEGDYYYLDATNDFLAFGTIPSFIQEKQVMIYIDENNYEVIEAGISECQNNLNQEKCRLYIDDDMLKGKFDIMFTGYEIERYKRIFYHLTKEKLEKRYQTYFAKGSNKSTLSNIETAHDSFPLKVSYDIEIGDYISKTNEEIYINMNLDKVFENQKIPDSRKQAIDMEQTYKFEKIYVLEIPQGYELTYKPDNFSYSDENLSFEIIYTHTASTLDYYMSMCINDLWINPSQFDDWNKFVKEIKNAYRENIILSKI